MKFIKIFILFVVISPIVNAQNDKELVVFDKNYKFADGIFIEFKDVLNNSPVKISNIITDISKGSYDFYDLLMNEESFVIVLENGTRKVVNTENIWGYSKNGKLHVKFEKEGTLIPVIGAICHFVGVSRYKEFQPNYTPYGYGYPYTDPNVENVETKQYIIDFSNGLVYEFNVKNLEVILINDTELYNEWLELSKRKRKKLIFVYLQKYNERNPLMLPKN